MNTCESVIAYIGVGSNVGDRRSYIEQALTFLHKEKGVCVKKVSSIIETEAQGPVQPRYLNGVVKLRTHLSPHELLWALQRIELLLGRKRDIRWGPRTIDLDILFYGQMRICEEDLTVPHPRIGEREFVWRPLLEIEPAFAGTIRKLAPEKREDC